MRFFHHKHQCYIEGEGSFVGHHGKLENLAENDKEGVKGIAASIERSILTINKSMSQSRLPQMIKVEVDMEPVVEDTSEVVFSNQFSVPESAVSFTLPGSITSIYEELGNTTTVSEEDEVVTEDGKTISFILTSLKRPPLQ